MSEISLRGVVDGQVLIHYRGHDFRIPWETFKACVNRETLGDYLDNLCEVLGHSNEQ